MHLKDLEKTEQTKSKFNKSKEIIKLTEEIYEINLIKTTYKTNKMESSFLKKIFETSAS